MSHAGSDGFYVTIIKGQPKPKNISWALGSFATYAEAEEKVGAVREYVLLNWPDAHWWSFGVTRVEPRFGRTLPVGVLNARFGITPVV